MNATMANRCVTGVAEMDLDHFGLFLQTTHLNLAISMKLDIGLRDKFIQLRDTAAEHFQHEEELMGSCGCLSPGHQAQHKRLLVLLSGLVELKVHGQDTIEALEEIFVRHITDWDVPVASYIRNFRAGGETADAVGLNPTS